jgi:UDPglucose 6-dehydrogenase
VKIVVFGAGPIGLVTSLSLIIWGHDVLCVDTNQSLIEELAHGQTTLYEADLQTELMSSLAKKRIQFTCEHQKAIEFSDVYFITVGTPNNMNGSSNLAAFNSCIASIVGANTSRKKNIIIKSTVPPKTNQFLTANYKNKNVTFISNPEFLREGQALKDSLNPDRIVIGSSDQSAIDLVLQIYEPLTHKTKFFVTDATTAEISKYAANTFLAAKISLINEFSKMTAGFGGDIQKISEIVGSDHRIGPDFLNSGLGFGGSCFPKDIRALQHLTEAHDLQMPFISAIETVNKHQHQRFSNLIQKNISEKKICIWGISFKPETNDLREASALKIIDDLLLKNFVIHIHDPILSIEFSKIYSEKIENRQIFIFNDPYLALNNCSALALCTEWDL